ncbi:MAG: YicC/YloC family endoribonuclease [Candidatus Kryptoniota bacterium]
MIQSMTGFGRGEAAIGEYSASAEIRSVNSRYLEVNVKLPQNLSARELDVREMIRQQIGRGKLSVIVSLSGSHEDDDVAVDPESVRKVISLLKSLKKSARISAPIKLEHILSFKDVFKGNSADSLNGDDWEAVRNAVNAALKQLQEARTVEGLSLKEDLSKRIDGLNLELNGIEKLSLLHIEEERSKLKQKVEEVLNGKQIDPARIELEIVLLADKLDITEEVVRFRTHNSFFMKLLNGEESNGRRLNFLLQEMNREANTMGSKVFDAEMSHLVVEIKEELEKIREQVQNLE